MNLDIDSYDAKTKLPELLREVQAGQSLTITLGGKPVAKLVPANRAQATLRSEAIAAMRAFLKVEKVSGDSVKAWIAAGRR